MYERRTDLALESHMRFSQVSRRDPEGVRADTYRIGDITVDCIEIVDGQGAEALGKPRGSYITMTLPPDAFADPERLFTGAKSLARFLSPMLPQSGDILVVGLGNRNITPDDLGPAAVGSVIVTRHLKSSMPGDFRAFRSVCAVTAGVLGLTGIETAEIVRGVTEHVQPAAVIAIDALAAMDAGRLCRTFQLTDTGITPGSGTGGTRGAITAETLGVPVIAIGVPTVIDAATLALGALETAGAETPPDISFSEIENLLVTPKDIDALISKSARTIGFAVNLALHGEMSLSEMEQFLS
ncbi:MAG: GPR endopeptidase [Clostridia bacterium]|nr:GPR endopeptidase [Clostridia bacterium]